MTIDPVGQLTGGLFSGQGGAELDFGLRAAGAFAMRHPRDLIREWFVARLIEQGADASRVFRTPLAALDRIGAASEYADYDETLDPKSDFPALIVVNGPDAFQVHESSSAPRQSRRELVVHVIALAYGVSPLDPTGAADGQPDNLDAQLDALGLLIEQSILSGECAKDLNTKHGQATFAVNDLWLGDVEPLEPELEAVAPLMALDHQFHVSYSVDEPRPMLGPLRGVDVDYHVNGAVTDPQPDAEDEIELEGA